MLLYPNFGKWKRQRHCKIIGISSRAQDVLPKGVQIRSFLRALQSAENIHESHESEHQKGSDKAEKYLKLVHPHFVECTHFKRINQRGMKRKQAIPSPQPRSGPGRDRPATPGLSGNGVPPTQT